MMSSSRIDLLIYPIRHCFIYFETVLLDEYELELLHLTGKSNNIAYCGRIECFFAYYMLIFV